jgi:perosamine synthetase
MIEQALNQPEKLALRGGSPVRSTPLPYARQTIEPDDLAAVNEALTADWITQGPLVARFERALAERVGAKHAVAVANGTAALHAACWAAGLGPGDEAITTPLTFAATANVVVYQGARPVFADIDGATLNISADAVKRVATARTRALLPVDYAGLPCEYERLLPLAREHGWTVIADAAHLFGGGSGGRAVGALADMTTLSFHPVKLITTGEGGAMSSRAATASGSAARGSSSCRRYPRTRLATAGISSSSCCDSTASRPIAIWSWERYAPRTSA